MSGALEAVARRIWDQEPGTTTARAFLRPVSWAYGAAVAVRNTLRDWDGAIAPPGIRVVSVGNLAVGGTGKTPLARWVVDELLDAGCRPALISRGYGSDEVALHAKWHPDVPVVVDPDRVDAVIEAAAAGADVAVLDDGFQHRRLARDVDLVLVAAEDAFPAPLLPAGPYREPPSALSRADAVIVTRKVATPAAAERLADKVRAFAQDAPLAQVHIRPHTWTTLSGTPSHVPDSPVLAATGIARPSAFWDAIALECGQEVELLAFNDHYEYDRPDAEHIRREAGDRIIAITEKDAIKLEPFADVLGDVRVMTVELEWESGLDAVRDLVRSGEPT